jgi:hypothetical protein
MARNPELALDAASLAADAVLSTLDGGYFRIYDGQKPATADTPVTVQALLAELRFGTPAFAPAVGGVAVAYPIRPDPSARMAGTATWFRVLRADGTAIVDGKLGTSPNNDLQVTSTSVQIGSDVSIVDWSYTQMRD